MFVSKQCLLPLPPGQEGCRRGAAPLSAQGTPPHRLGPYQRVQGQPWEPGCSLQGAGPQGTTSCCPPGQPPQLEQGTKQHRLLVLILWRVTLILKDSPASMTVPGLACPLSVKCPEAWKPGGQAVSIGRPFSQLVPYWPGSLLPPQLVHLEYSPTGDAQESWSQWGSLVVLVIRSAYVALSPLLHQHGNDGKRRRIPNQGWRRGTFWKAGQQCQGQRKGFPERRGVECYKEASMMVMTVKSLNGRTRSSWWPRELGHTAVTWGEGRTWRVARNSVPELDFGELPPARNPSPDEKQFPSLFSSIPPGAVWKSLHLKQECPFPSPHCLIFLMSRE